jgi:hypothetical protein
MKEMITPVISDDEREISIQKYQSKLVNLKLSSEEKRDIWNEIKSLINSRTPERIRIMEEELGLVNG